MSYFRSMGLYFKILLLAVIFLLVVIFVRSYFVKEFVEEIEEIERSEVVPLSKQQPQQLPIEEEEDSNQKILSSSVSQTLPNFILLDVPFTPQAPFAQWQDPIYQNACEEAVLVMAMYWLRGQPLTAKEAEEEIFILSEYQKQNYGHFHDTSAADTLKLLKDFYNYQKADLFYDINIEDIKRELAQGNLVIIPVNGQKLSNLFYVPPGPLEHMLLVRGYDDITKEFITNDPGTRRGDGYRYSYKILEDALRDYPSGFHQPIEEIKTAMIVVKKP